MKVELLVNLKLGNGKVVSAGTVFSDENTPIPDFVMRRLRRKMARVIQFDPKPSPAEPLKSEVAGESEKEVIPAVVKRIIKKKVEKKAISKD